MSLTIPSFLVGPPVASVSYLGQKDHLAAPALHGVAKNALKMKTWATMSQITSGPGVLLNFVLLVSISQARS